MNWISIDRQKCTGCGICVSICFQAFSQKAGRIEGVAGPNNCNLCGHCVAICPARAIVHHRMNMEAFIDLNDGDTIGQEAFMNFLRSRRSHRNFLGREIDPEVMENLFDVCRFAPTGSNVQNVEILVLRNREKIEKLIDLSIDYYRKLIPRVRRKVEKFRSEGKRIPPDLQWSLKRNKTYSRLVKNRDSGGDPIFRGAHTILIFHSISHTSAPHENCVIAAHTVALTARTMGLETCYIGLFAGAHKNYPPVARKLNLARGHQVFSVLAIGYPKYRFLRTVERKPLKIQWG
jgi:nitroreductase/NAD-dependent dihydropyrimidine dehydrogenase PreA subunit